MPETQNQNPEAVKAEWRDRLDRLVLDVKTWAEADGWKAKIYKKPMKEDPALGRYDAPRLVMERIEDGVVVALDPVARYVPGADGAVDLYLMPGYDDIASLYFYFKSDEWVVHYARRPDPDGPRSVIEGEALPYNEATIRSVLDAMATHHA